MALAQAAADARTGTADSAQLPHAA
jgi:hypothetical protein